MAASRPFSGSRASRWYCSSLRGGTGATCVTRRHTSGHRRAGEKRAERMMGSEGRSATRLRVICRSTWEYLSVAVSPNGPLLSMKLPRARVRPGQPAQKARSAARPDAQREHVCGQHFQHVVLGGAELRRAPVAASDGFAIGSAARSATHRVDVPVVVGAEGVAKGRGEVAHDGGGQMDLRAAVLSGAQGTQANTAAPRADNASVCLRACARVCVLANAPCCWPHGRRSAGRSPRPAPRGTGRP